METLLTGTLALWGVALAILVEALKEGAKGRLDGLPVLGLAIAMGEAVTVGTALTAGTSDWMTTILSGLVLGLLAGGYWAAGSTVIGAVRKQ